MYAVRKSVTNSLNRYLLYGILYYATLWDINESVKLSLVLSIKNHWQEMLPLEDYYDVIKYIISWP